MERKWELPQRGQEKADPFDDASADARRRRRRILVGLGVCLGIAVFFGVRAAWRTHQAPEQKRNLHEKEIAPGSTGPQKQGEVPVTTERDRAEHRPTLPATVESLKKEETEVARRLMADLPGSSDAIALMALVHERYGRSGEAVKCWEECLELNPNRADAYDGMGWVALQKEEHEKAVVLLRKALEINPAMPGVHNNLACALVNLDKPEEAVEVLKEAIRISPRASQSHFMLGQVCLQLRQYEKARQSFEAALEIEPDHRNACYGLATAWARLGQRDQFRECMERFKKVDARQLKSRMEGARAFEDLAAMRRGAAETHTNAGRVYFAHGDPGKAVEHWQRAATLDPGNAACRRELARLHQATNRAGEAGFPTNPQVDDSEE
jgi:tetratricopeptide (TPR) repeat protein